MASPGPVRIAVCGPGVPTAEEATDAETIGYQIGAAGCQLYCGGLGGAMEAACRGAKRAGGTTIGILPGYDRSTANRWVDIPICTGMGHGRNAILVASVDVVIASGGGWGTLSEIALAARLGRPVVVHAGWSDALRTVEPGHGTALIHFESDPVSSVQRALELAHRSR